MITNTWARTHPPKAILVLGLVPAATFRQIMAIGAADVVVVHPDEAAVAALAEPDWLQSAHLTIDPTVIASVAGKSKFYKMSLLRESGFIDPAELRFLWKNIEADEIADYPSVSLADYLSNSDKSFDWIISERLDFGSLLEQASDHLELFDLIICRHLIGDQVSMLNNYAPPEPTVLANGFTAAETLESRHPNLRSTIFCNDWKSRLGSKITDLTSEIAGLQSEAGGLKTELSAANTELTDRKTEFTTLNVAFLEKSDELNSLREQLDEQAKRFQEAQERVAELSRDLESSKDLNSKFLLTKNDLADLQTKYRVLCERNEALERFARSVFEEASAGEALFSKAESPETPMAKSK